MAEQSTISCRIYNALRDPLWPAKLLYFLNLFSLSAIVNFIPKFYKDLGYSLGQITILQTLLPFCFIVGAPFWGYVADRTQKPRLVLIFTILSGGALMFCMQFITNYTWICVLFVFASLQTGPIGSLIDQTVMEMITSLGGEYGRQRMFGAFGYGVGAIVVAEFVSAYGIKWLFHIHLITAVMQVFAIMLFPSASSSSKTSPQEASIVTLTANIEKERVVTLADGMKEMWRKKDLLVLFILALFQGVVIGAICFYLPYYILSIANENSRLVSYAVFINTVSEVPAFFLADSIVERFGVSKVLMASIAAYGLRLVSYAVLNNAWFILPFELLHGISFSLSWAAFTNYTFAASDRETEGTMMGLLSAMFNGYGKGFGALIGGLLYNSFGSTWMWSLMLVFVAISLVSLATFQKTQHHNEASRAHSVVSQFGVVQTPLGSQKRPSFLDSPL